MHGTTVATNAVLEGKGAKVGLITTEGFKQILHLARSWTPGPLAGWIIMEKPEPPAAIENTREAKERIDTYGEIVKPLDEDALRQVLQDLVNRGVEAITVSLINSYVNPAHEKRVKAIAQEMFPSLPVTASAEDAVVLGLEVPREAARLRERIGYMTQKFSLYEDLTVAENHEFLADIYAVERSAARERIVALCTEYRLGKLRERLAGTLLGGQRQRLAVAGALIHQPDLLFLDAHQRGRPREPARLLGVAVPARGPRHGSWSRPTTWTRPSAVTASRSSTAVCSSRAARRAT